MIEKGDDSREKILRAAERIFAEKGLAGASVRTITSAAGVNHALIGYYFGSKVALYEEVLERTAELIAKPKLERLAELREINGETPIPIRDLLDAYIRPFFDDYGDPKSISRTWLRFYGRIFSEHSDEINQTTLRSGNHLRGEFLREIKKTLHALSRKDILYRFGALIGVISFWRGETGILGAHFDDKAEAQIEVNELIEEVISICCAIFAAESAPGSTAIRKGSSGTQAQKSINSRNDNNDLLTSAAKKSRRHRKRAKKAG